MSSGTFFLIMIVLVVAMFLSMLCMFFSRVIFGMLSLPFVDDLIEFQNNSVGDLETYRAVKVDRQAVETSPDASRAERVIWLERGLVDRWIRDFERNVESYNASLAQTRSRRSHWYWRIYIKPIPKDLKPIILE